jgi:Domain of unknown function (DUF4494)
MKTWFICTVKYHREDEQGNIRKITEPYLVDAVSFTDAETRIYQELQDIIPGEFTVNDISRSNFADIFHYDDADTWYKCKVSYVTVDEIAGKEKKVTNYMLVSAHTIKEAYERLEESLSTMLVPFTVQSITVSSYMEVFVYDGETAIPKHLKPLSSIQAQES